MTKILLHNKDVELSRTLLAALPSDATSVDCSSGIPTSYTGPTPSAYPTVVVDVPAYSETVAVYDETGGLTGTATQDVAEHLEALRAPASWDAVDAYNAMTAARAVTYPAGASASTSTSASDAGSAAATSAN